MNKETKNPKLNAETTSEAITSHGDTATPPEPEMLDEYDFSQGVRGKYASRYRQGTNLVLLSPDVAEAFPDAETINEALRSLIELARRSVNNTKGDSTEAA